MHRRRGNQISETGHGGIHHLSSSSTRRRSAHPSPSSNRRGDARSGKVGFVILLVVLFSALIVVEFAAYRMLGGMMPPSSSSSSTADSPPTTNRDTGSAARKKNALSVRDDPPPVSKRNDASTPTKQPASFAPTDKQNGWRVKAARRAAHENGAFWKTHAPDPLPPPPPDVDAATGEKLPPVVAYVVTLTKCGPKHRGGLDGAAALLHSIRRNSHGWVPMEERRRRQRQQQHNADDGEEDAARPRYGGRGGRYRYRAYAIVDPAASPLNPGRSGDCARFLQKIGYAVLHRPPLVPLFELPDGDGGGKSKSYYEELKAQGYVGMRRPPSSLRAGEHPDKLRKFMHNDGCCGYAELLKLHVYGMVEHELAVHLDFDSLLLRPMDDLFDAMLGRGGGGEDERRRRALPLLANNLPRTKEVDLSRRIDAAFTRDYNQVNRPSPDAPVGYQGGFLVVRPDVDVLERYRDALREGDFLLGPRTGWAGRFGGFYGDVTFQGILPYYYEHVAPKYDEEDGVVASHNEAELDRCVFNQMADNPRKSTYKFPRATPLDADKMGFKDTNICRDGRKECSDTNCQLVHPKDSITTHFTFCKKPWDCSDGNPGTVVTPTCLGLLKEWYAIRRELEDWWLLPSSHGSSSATSNAGANNQQSFYWHKETISRVKQSRSGSLDSSQYLGYCSAIGTEGYRRLVEPDGPKS